MTTASFTPAEFYNNYKLTCVPTIFRGDHISDMVSTLLLGM